MRLSSILHVVGVLLLLLAPAMLVPIPFSLYYGDHDWLPLLASAVITAVIGFGLRRLAEPSDIRHREGFAVVTFSWLLASLCGSLPFLLSGAIPSFTDAFFETISGLTTTGASVLTDVEALPHGVLFWRSLTHWLGGMGIIVLSVAILPFLGVGGMELYRAEGLRFAGDRLTPRIADTARILWGVYVVLTVAMTLLLLLGGMNLFDALCHSFGAIATGGYSTRNAGMAAFPSPFIHYVTVVFMLLGAINFSLHYQARRGDLRVYFRNYECRFYLLFLAIATAVTCAYLFTHGESGIERTVREALFQVTSIGTTTGFATADFAKWPHGPQFILVMLMLLGGCAGSTGGGIKQMRVYIVLRFVVREITRMIHPNAVVPVRTGREAVQREIVANILGFFILYMFTFGVGVLLISLFGYDLPTSVGGVAATMGGVGPGLGVVGPMSNYGHFPPAAKWIFSTLMIMGRLEIYTLVIIVYPSFWRR